MSVPTHSADVLRVWDEFDNARPVGHVSRREALFAAPEIHGAHRWLHNAFLSERHQQKTFLFNAITVESDNVRVYSVLEYECGANQPDPVQRAKDIYDYWNTSMALTDWLGIWKQDYFSDSWEILLPEHEVISYEVLTYSQIRELYIQGNLGEHGLSQLDSILRPRLDAAYTLRSQTSLAMR